ncbi:MAG: hypothetical protein WC758_00825 [Candidatus Woesearchaeota archaeon]|jgi:hypothetical protein
MVSFKLRRVFFAAAEGAEEILAQRKKELTKLDDLENQINLAKKIMNSMNLKDGADPASIIRIEGRLKKIERKVIQKRRNLNYV